MAQFKFKVADANGQIKNMIFEGANEQDALGRLRNRGFVALRFYGASSAGDLGVVKSFKYKNFDVVDFTSRLLPLLDAHVPLEKALQIMMEGAKNKTEVELISALRLGLRDGRKFSEMIREQGKAFPPIYANLIEAGEETGCLPQVVRQLNLFLTDSKELKDFLITSSIYPGIILTVTVGVLVLVFAFFIPYFAKMFVDMGKTLPLPTQILLSISEFLSALWWVWPILIGAGIFGWIKVRQDKRYMLKFSALLLRIPVCNKIIEDINMSRFFRTMAILIQNHVHLLSSVRIACNVLSNQVILESFSQLQHDLRGGDKLSDAIGKSKFAPKMAVQMLQVAEESGDFGPMLNQVATNMEGKLKVKIKRLLSLFEPAVIIFLAITILIVVLAIFMAIMEMNDI